MTIMFWTLLVWGIAVAHVTAFVPIHAAPFRPSLSSSSSSRKSQLWASKKSSRDSSFDSDERLDAETNPYAYLFPQDTSSQDEDDKHDTRPETVHCIFFQPGTEEQGMHTVEQPAGSGNNMILAFESKDSCDKFASRLRDLQFFDLDPTPYEIGLTSLESFCKPLGVFVQVIPDGVDLIPPSKRVETLGHKDPAIRQKQNELNNIFATMLSTDEKMDEEGVLVGDYGSSWE